MAIRLNKLINIFADQVQEIEDTLDDVENKCDLDTAIGTQLDGLGEIVNEPRLGRSDIDYAAALRVRIAINDSCGEIPILLTTLDFITGATDVSLEEHVAAISFHVYGVSSLPSNTVELMKRVMAGGIGIVDISYASGIPFGFETDPEALGFGEGEFASTVR
jgi:hypothetical protein